MKRILLIGSGAREHAIARAIQRSPQRTSLFCFGSSKNPGILAISTHYATGNLLDASTIASYARHHRIDFAIVGPEGPLEAGIADELWSSGIPVIGPQKVLAQIESSKSFTRDLLVEFGIEAYPKYKYFTSIDGVPEFIDELSGEYVIKADGLMGGKGVKLSGEHLHSTDEALSWCEQIIDAEMGFLIEEKFVGQEFSLISFSDGEHLAHTPAVQDHKRAYDGDTGPNTGGMGTYSDADHSLPFLTQQDIAKAHEINVRTIDALKKKTGLPYKGILYGGFIATATGVKLIEYNARFGDPEAMNILTLLESDFVAICDAILTGTLEQNHARFAHKASVCVYVVPEGYPDNPVKNQKIDFSAVSDKRHLFLGAVDQREDGVYETGSRTAAIVCSADSLAAAQERTLAEISKIEGPLFHRKDIGTAQLIQKRIDMMQSLRGSTKGKLRLAVLGSTRGTTMQHLMDAINEEKLNASIEIVISNKEGAYILHRAQRQGIDTLHIPHSGKTREQYDSEVISILKARNIDLVLLIGYMRILSPTFVNAFKGKILNVHPSLLPKFAGGMDLAVHKAVLDAGERESGCTVHLVDEGVDTGAILIQKKCSVEPGDTPELLKQKVQHLEGVAFIEAIHTF